MLSHDFCTNASLVAIGLMAGVAMVPMLGSSAANNGTETFAEGTFGDIRLVTVPLETSDTRAVMTLLKGDVPIIHLYRNDANEVDRFAVANGAHGTVALGRLTEAGISEFVLHGNEVHNGLRMPVLTIDASARPGVWHKARYTPTVGGVYSDGKLISYRVVGEVYHDIDFDGQFDARDVYDKESIVTSQCIFIDGQWIELARRDVDGEWRRLGRFETGELEAFTIEGDSKVSFDFVCGGGWHKRAKKSGP